MSFPQRASGRGDLEDILENIRRRDAASSRISIEIVLVSIVHSTAQVQIFLSRIVCFPQQTKALNGFWLS